MLPIDRLALLSVTLSDVEVYSSYFTLTSICLGKDNTYVRPISQGLFTRELKSVCSLEF